MAEETKKKQQIEAFLRQTEPRAPHDTWIDRLNPYRFMKPKNTIVQNLPRNPSSKQDSLPPDLNPAHPMVRLVYLLIGVKVVMVD